MSYTTIVLDTAQEALKSGNKAEARRIVQPVVEAEPQNARAWYLLAEATEDADQRFYYKTRGDQAHTSAMPPPASAAPLVSMASVSHRGQPPMVATAATPVEIAHCEKQIIRLESRMAIHKRSLAFVPMSQAVNVILGLGGVIGSILLLPYGLGKIGMVVCLVGAGLSFMIGIRKKNLTRMIEEGEQEIAVLRQQLKRLKG